MPTLRLRFETASKLQMAQMAQRVFWSSMPVFSPPAMLERGSKFWCKAEAAGTDGEARKPRVLVLGGTGRVGGSTVRALVGTSPRVQVIVAGRNRQIGAALAEELGNGTEFAQFDNNDSSSLRAALEGVDLVVHAAGPFQRREECTVLEAAIATKTPYIDVCDDQEHSKLAKKLHEQAVAAEVAAITTTGIYPGVSNIMAAELVRLARAGTGPGTGSEPERLRFSYYTAGSGGAGPTILATSFLLLGEEVVAYRKGEELKLKAYTGEVEVDFGKAIGKKPVYLLNLPEVASCHRILGVPSVSARFGTDPIFWNWAMAAVANFVPPEILKDERKVSNLVKLADPLVRAFDGIAGEKMSIRVDLECSDGRKAVGIFSHKELSVCVGVATAAFARAVLEGSTKPGVWFPEEEGGIAAEDRPKLLERATKGTLNFVMNRPPWMIESDPKELGFGIYLQ